VVSWDCYPWPSANPSDIAFLHDLNRGLKDGQPFMLMEQTPSSQNWQPVNALKRPGVLRLWSYLALAHGADTVMYFQWRRGRGGCEKFHGAVVEHGGRSDTRVFREVSALGAELASLGATTLGATTPARVAILFDWNNWWALDAAIGPIQDKAYVATVRKHYQALWRCNVPVDVVFSDSDLSSYDMLIAPLLHMVKPGLAERIEALVARGGTFVTTYFSQIVMADGSGNCTCARLCDIIHSEGARVYATYGDDFYAGTPAVTEHHYGDGWAYYLASDPEDAFLDTFYARLLAAYAIAPLLTTPPGVEVTLRQTERQDILFILNHNPVEATIVLSAGVRYADLLSAQEITGSLTLAGYDVCMLARERG
jgi:beta-galactosidase